MVVKIRDDDDDDDDEKWVEEVVVVVVVEATFSIRPYPIGPATVDGICLNVRVPGVDSF